MLNSNLWVANQWPSHAFFDPRLHKRAITIASTMLKQPTASIPGRFSLQKEIKGCYRFLDNKAINHQMLQRSHYENVLNEAASEKGRVLFIQDGSELIYNHLKWTDLGPTADASGNGIMFHSCLAVKFTGNQPQVIGLTGQKAWIREQADEKSDRKTREERESQVWQEMIDQIGPVPAGCKWTTVGDRGADIFSFVDSLAPGWDCVVRSKHDRKIVVNGVEQRLKQHMRLLPSMGITKHFLRARKSGSREVTLHLSWAKVEIIPPKTDEEKAPIEGWYVRTWCEEDPDLEWILFTKSPVTSLVEALEIANIYKHRWLIEEYHKCLKTGCQIEKVQLRTRNRILALFGMLGVIATQLIQLKGISRTNPDEPAEKHVDKVAIALLQEIYSLKTPLTVGEFWRRVPCWSGLWAESLTEILGGKRFGKDGLGYKTCVKGLILDVN